MATTSSVARASTPRRRLSLGGAAGLAAVVTGSALLRVIHLGTLSLWLDESFRVGLARFSWPDFLRAAWHPFGMNSIAFHMLLRYWMLLGDGETILRALSVLLSLATIVALYQLGTELFDRRTALLAAALAGVNAFLIAYAQQVCAYTMAGLLAVVSSLYFLRSLDTNTRANWARYIVAAAVMIYCHVVTIFIVAAHYLAAALLPGSKWRRQGLAALLVIGGAFAPLAYSFMFVPPHPRPWLPRPGIEQLRAMLEEAGGPGSTYLWILCAILLILALVETARSGPRERSAGWRCTFLFMWALLPPLLLFVVSQRESIFLARYLLGCAPPLLLLVAAAAFRLRRRWLLVACTLALLLFSLRSSVLYLRRRSVTQNSDNWRQASAYVVKQAQAGDTVVFYYPFERFPFDYYRRHAAGFSASVFPSGSEEELLERANSVPGDSLPASLAASRLRVWMMSAYLPSPGTQHFSKLMAESFQAHEERHFGFIRVELFSRPASGAR